jgi:hypothetical protein
LKWSFLVSENINNAWIFVKMPNFVYLLIKSVRLSSNFRGYDNEKYS